MCVHLCVHHCLLMELVINMPKQKTRCMYVRTRRKAKEQKAKDKQTNKNNIMSGSHLLECKRKKAEVCFFFFAFLLNLRSGSLIID